MKWQGQTIIIYEIAPPNRFTTAVALGHLIDGLTFFLTLGYVRTGCASKASQELLRENIRRMKEERRA